MLRSNPKLRDLGLLNPAFELAGVADLVQVRMFSLEMAEPLDARSFGVRSDYERIISFYSTAVLEGS
jgi:hypothetical protein